ncbi:Tas Predicted oxidoreductases (related to aryl-alcohol dehydrogenases) [Burkholderiaceae bacterium]
MNKIALGTVQFGMKYGISNQSGIVSPEEIISILKTAAKFGIDTLDTAINYKDSESKLGQNNLSNFKIITKIPKLPSQFDDIKSWVFNHFQSSLQRLKVSNIYGLLLHSPEDLLGINGPLIYNALRTLKDSGKILKIGISINSFDTLEKILDLYKFDLIQSPFNLIDRRLLNTGFLNRLKDEKYEVHTRSVFLQGLLLMNECNRPTQFSKWNPLWNEASKWCSNNSVSLLQSAIQFPLSFAEIDRVVVGIENTEQLIEINQAAFNDKNIQSYPDIECEDLDLINPSKWFSF